MKAAMKTDLFNYHLPLSLIAQHPEKKRDNCKLLIYNRKTKQITHGIFKDITDYISPVVLCGKAIAQRIKGTPGITG